MRGRVVVAVALGLLVTLAAWSARAAGVATETPTVPLLPTTTTTSTTAPPSTTTTTQAGSSSTTTTTSPPGPAITIPGTPAPLTTTPPGQTQPLPQSQPQPSTVPPPPTTPGGGTPDAGGDQPVPAGEIPPNYQKIRLRRYKAA